MIMFWVVAAILIAGALLLLLPPLLGRGKRAVSATRSEVNLSVYRDQIHELDADLAAGTLDETQHASARSDLERRVLEESANTEIPAIQSSGSRWPVVVVAIAVPLLAVSLYFWLGTPAGLEPQPQATETEQTHPTTPEQIEAMVAGLAQRLKSEPDNAEGWVMLARSYTALRRYQDASAAYTRAVELLPNNAFLLADHADMLAMVKRTLQGEPEKIILRALKVDPNNLKALSLAGSAAFERKDYRNAIKWWEKILKLVPPESQGAASTVSSINEARAKAGLPPMRTQAGDQQAAAQPGMAGGSVSGTVMLDPALKARVADTDMVFIFARAAGEPRMPLAVIRKTVKDLPLVFTLDDSMAVMPSLKLSSAARLVVGARISKSGSATPGPGDLQGLSQPVKAGTKDISITIDSEVK